MDRVNRVSRIRARVRVRFIILVGQLQFRSVSSYITKLIVAVVGVSINKLRV